MLAQALAALRGERTQRSMAVLCGRTQTWWSYIENGHREPRISDLEVLSREGLCLFDGEWLLNTGAGTPGADAVSAAEQHQRQIWESRCPELLAERDRLAAAMELSNRIARNRSDSEYPRPLDRLDAIESITREALAQTQEQP